VQSVGENCLVSPSDMLSVSKSQLNSADSICCIDTVSDSVEVSAVLLPPTVDSLISECDSVTVAEIVQSSVISSQCESRSEDCYTVTDCENSNKTSSSTEMSCDTVIACSGSYCML